MKFTEHFQAVFSDTVTTTPSTVEQDAQPQNMVEMLLASDALTPLLRAEPGLTLLQRIAEITEQAFAENNTENDENPAEKAVEYLLEVLEQELVKNVLSTSAALLEHTLEVIKLLYPDLEGEGADDAVKPEHNGVFFAADLAANLLRDCAMNPIRVNMLLLDDTSTRLQKELQDVLESLAFSMGIDPEMLVQEAAKEDDAQDKSDEDEQV